MGGLLCIRGFIWEVEFKRGKENKVREGWMKEYRRLKEKVLESMRCSFGEQDRKVYGRHVALLLPMSYMSYSLSMWSKIFCDQVDVEGQGPGGQDGNTSLFMFFFNIQNPHLSPILFFGGDIPLFVFSIKVPLHSKTSHTDSGHWPFSMYLTRDCKKEKKANYHGSNSYDCSYCQLFFFLNFLITLLLETEWEGGHELEWHFFTFFYVIVHFFV